MSARIVLVVAMLPALLQGQKVPPTRPQIRGIFPHGAQRGTDVDVSIRGSDFQNASEIRFSTPKLTAQIVSVEYNLIKARVHLDGGRFRSGVAAGHWRLVEISKECAVVEMCACTGEPMERVETDDPTMIDYLRTADSGAGAS